MVELNDRCPICRNDYDNESRRSGNAGPVVYFDCSLCGMFGIADNLIRDIDQLSIEPNRLNGAQRARLIKYVHDRSRAAPTNTFIVVQADLGFVFNEMRLPSPGEQAVNIIRYVGDRLVDSADGLDNLPLDFFVLVGSPSPRRAGLIVEQLLSDGIFIGSVGLPRRLLTTPSGSVDEKQLTVSGLDLTLRGWDRYEAEKRGRYAGPYGFVARKFVQAPLDILLRDHTRPALKQELGLDLIDMRDAARAGVIDNVMREKIRDAAFVVADLTDDNAGAYWEAGYAEGLGKPVLYICERGKFERGAPDGGGTHFDTNHLTTVLWIAGEEAQFVAEFIATLKRSLEEKNSMAR